MRIPESKIAEVALAADIVQVISGYVDLKRAGKDFRGICPFHGDKDPSFYVSPQKGIFHCFGCAVGGSVFNFIMKMENVSFVEAVRMLAGRYGVDLPAARESAGARDERERLAHALETSRIYFSENLRRNEAARDYLSSRGIPAEWMNHLGFGFAPDSWDGMERFLAGKGIRSVDASAAGLVKPRPSGGYYDYFRSRIMIPIHELGGRHVAYGGRILGPGDPKYLNSPDSTIFHKRSVLYGLDSAREAIRREGFVVMVEGYFDQISLRIRGLENTVAPLGTALGSEQIRLLKRFATQVITVFDGDEAGLKAVKRSLPLFLAEGIEPRCVILTEDKDPDEAVNRMGVDAFRLLLDNSVSMIDFFLEHLESQYDLRGLHGRNLALEESLPVLREVADSRERDYFIERFSSRIRIREERLRRMVSTGAINRRPVRESRGDARKSLYDFPADERNVVRGMLLREGFLDLVIESGVLSDLEDPVLGELARSMVEFRGENGEFDPLSFSRSLEEAGMASLVAGWLKPRPEEDDLRPEVDGYIAMDHSLDRIRLRRLEKRKDEITAKMNMCTPCGDEYNALAMELWAIGQRLHK